MKMRNKASASGMTLCGKGRSLPMSRAEWDG